jgi:hypothetical protein
MTDMNSHYIELKDDVLRLEEKFINRYLPANPETNPAEYTLDVRAYCVLSHAAFEEFIETVALSVVTRAVEQWVISRTVNNVIPALLSCHAPKQNIQDFEKSDIFKPFDYLRPLIEQAKATFSKHVHDNHGVSLTYLRSLLLPAAIEITQDANLLNSLHKLAEGRGAYAHRGRVTTVLAPEDAKRYVQDVLKVCEDILSKSEAI